MRTAPRPGSTSGREPLVDPGLEKSCPRILGREETQEETEVQVHGLPEGGRGGPKRLPQQGRCPRQRVLGLRLLLGFLLAPEFSDNLVHGLPEGGHGGPKRLPQQGRCPKQRDGAATGVPVPPAGAGGPAKHHEHHNGLALLVLRLLRPGRDQGGPAKSGYMCSCRRF